MKPVVIVGASQFADVARFYLSRDAGHRIAGFSVDPAYLRETTVDGLPVVAFDELERTFPPETHSLFVAIGPHAVNRARSEKFREAQTKGYTLISYVSSRATVWPDLVHGPNTFITETSWIMPSVRLGANVAIWGAHIGHHSTIGDHCMVSGATLAGGVDVGDHTFIGLNASVKERVRIGRRNVIGAGAVILMHTRDDAVHALHHTRASRIKSDRLR